MHKFPESDPVSQPYWDGLREGKLKVQHCSSCSKHIYYPRRVCPHCMSADLDWSDASGRGSLHAYSVVYRHWDKSFVTPFVVALVELEEGVIMTATIVDVEPDPAKISIGMPVELATFTHEGEPSLPAFRLRCTAA